MAALESQFFVKRFEIFMESIGQDKLCYYRKISACIVTGWKSQTTADLKLQDLNPSTSVKPVITSNFKSALLQNLFVALVNMDIFQMTLKFRLFTVD